MDVITDTSQEDTPKEDLSLERINLIKNKVYSLNGNDFSLREPSLEIKNGAAKWYVAYRKNMFFNTAGIPIKEVEAVEKRLYEELKESFEQCLSLSKDETKPQEERAKSLSEYDRIKAIYDKEFEEFLANDYLQEIRQLHTDAVNGAWTETLTDKDLIIPLMQQILKGKVGEIHSEQPGIWQFISEVMPDFLFLANTMP